MAKQEALFKLTVDDEARLGKELAQCYNELLAEEADFDDAKAAHKERVEGIQERIDRLASTLNQGATHEPAGGGDSAAATA